MADEPENLVLIHLQGIRREMAAMLERQVSDRELTSRLYKELLKVQDELMKVHDELASFRSETRQEFRDLKADLIRLEMQMQNRHNEVLSITRRLDELGAPLD